MGLSYYNDNDPAVCAWVQNLVDAGRIPPGDVDCRSIIEINPDEVRRYTQCHFFCGIAGWSVALALAGWPTDRPVWTGSCPCQPFSGAGRGKGYEDERHLWPAFYALIRECRPSAVFGEQVASADGRLWLAAVRSDLEALGYAVGAADLCAAGAGAPHIRQRLYWVANAESQRGRTGLRVQGAGSGGHQFANNGSVDGLGDSDNDRCYPAPLTRFRHAEPNAQSPSGTKRMDDAGLSGAARYRQHGREGQATELAAGSAPTSLWSQSAWIECRDGKHRPVESGVAPLANGIPGRLVKLRAYGNAIVPQIAAAFVTAAANDNTLAASPSGLAADQQHDARAPHEEAA